jgi:hypothetical protein
MCIDWAASPLEWAGTAGRLVKTKGGRMKNLADEAASQCRGFAF